MSSNKALLEALGCENDEDLANILQAMDNQKMNERYSDSEEEEITSILVSKSFEPCCDDANKERLTESISESLITEKEDNSFITFSQAERLIEELNKSEIDNFSDVASLLSADMNSFHELLNDSLEEDTLNEAFIEDISSSESIKSESLLQPLTHIAKDINTLEFPKLESCLYPLTHIAEDISSPESIKSESLLQPLTYTTEDINSSDLSPCKSTTSSFNLWDSDEDIVSIC